jgi:hypothetical protein
MGLSINDTAPDFEADRTQGRLKFHEWADDIEETPGCPPQLSDHRRRRLPCLQAVRHAPGDCLGRPEDAHTG